MKNRFFLGMMALLLTAAVSLNSCKDDEPKTTKVFGTITMENTDVWNTWQDSGVVEVTIFPAFSLDPAAGWGEVPGAGTFPLGAPYNSQDPVVLTYEAGKTQYDYEIEVEPGTYSAIAVGIRHNRFTDPNCKTATLGVYFGNENEVSYGIVIPNTPLNYPSPSTITVKAEEQKELNFKADFSFVNVWYPATNCK